MDEPVKLDELAQMSVAYEWDGLPDVRIECHGCDPWQALDKDDDIERSIGPLKSALARIRDLAAELEESCGCTPTRIDITVPDELFDKLEAMNSLRDYKISHPTQTTFTRYRAGKVEVIFHRPPR